MGSLGWPEILMILVVALIIFGPRKLPELGKTLGQSLAQFRKASEDFKRTWEEEVEIEKRKIDAPSSSTTDEAANSQAQEEPGGEAAPPPKEDEPNYWNEDFNLHGSQTTAEAEPAEAIPIITQEGAAVPRQSKRDWM